MGKIRKSWRKLLEKLNAFELIDDIYNTDKTIYPPKEDVFNCFKHFKLKNTKVVLLGQDPYIRKDQAVGLAFSIPKNQKKIPPSLKNIYKELAEEYDNFEIPNHGDISRWNTEENILLLNTALTVEEGKSNIHKKIWSDITNKLIETISNKCKFVVFILLGNNAKSKIKYIDTTKHFIVSGVHPSPLSANYHLKGTIKSFYGNNIFRKVNQKLEENNISPIDWNIDKKLIML